MSAPVTASPSHTDPNARTAEAAATIVVLAALLSLQPVTTDAYLPALPTSQLTPVHVLAKLNDIGDDHLRPQDESALEPVRALCDRLEQAMAADAANRPLIQAEEAATEQS